MTLRPAESQQRQVNHHALVVSLHDVSPHTRGECARIVSELCEIGLTCCSLLVVPNHHHRGHFLQDAAFCGWLNQLAEEGHEIVVHGYFHQRPRRNGETLQQKLTTRVYTAGEGEFFDLDRETAKELAGRAAEEFRQAGFKPEGFIAPAWLLNREGERALCELGYQYTTRLRTVLDLQTGRTYDSQSLVWSVRSGWRRATSVLWNATLQRGLASNPLLRISVHPVDIRHRAVWRQICSAVKKALSNRVAFTYERWVARQRTFALAHANGK